MPGRKFTSEDYRFGFNGKEDDKDWGTQDIQDYGFRLYNPSIAKFLSVDPLAPEYPWNSTYAFAEGDVIRSIDLDGLEKEIINEVEKSKTRTPVLEIVKDYRNKPQVNTPKKPPGEMSWLERAKKIGTGVVTVTAAEAALTIGFLFIPANWGQTGGTPYIDPAVYEQIAQRWEDWQSRQTKEYGDDVKWSDLPTRELEKLREWDVKNKPLSDSEQRLVNDWKKRNKPHKNAYDSPDPAQKYTISDQFGKTYHGVGDIKGERAKKSLKDKQAQYGEAGLIFEITEQFNYSNRAGAYDHEAFDIITTAPNNYNVNQSPGKAENHRDMMRNNQNWRNKHQTK